ncbi:hypothetical protein [Litoribacter populi]|uniref:hypothetical protein n=1 Tax=Litoribacter populi TaxID=2598460 RepID=UPI001180E480|nr:hypothetical protein [Litoribacter populi]
MKIPSEYDIAHLRSIYNFSVESSDDYEDYQVYYPRVVSNVTLYPFSTYVYIGRGDPYFPSDKFIGESTFFIDGKEDHVDVDMYRFSAGIGFRVLNLASGTIEITFNLHQYSFSYYLDSQNSEIREIRPVNSVFSSNQFTNNLLDSPENVRHHYNITVKLHEEDDIGEVKERILLNSEIYLRRNFMTTYELDMDPFYQEPEREGGVLKLDFVDNELIDRGVENF